MSVEDAHCRISSPPRCHFLKKEIVNPGHVLDRRGVRANNDKVTAIRADPATKDKQSFESSISTAHVFLILF